MTRPVLLTVVLLASLPSGLFAEAAPPNAPADIRVEGDPVVVRYDGATLFDGRS